MEIKGLNEVLTKPLTEEEEAFECCKNCKRCLKIEQWDYSGGGCQHITDVEGWACLAFANEDAVIHVIGLDEEAAHCEMWQEK